MKYLSLTVLSALLVFSFFACKKNDERKENPPDKPDVYVVGYETDNVTLRNVAKLWKNDTAQSLTQISRDGYASAVCVSGNDVYVAGQELISGSGDVAKVWKNGVVKNLTNGSQDADVSSLFVAGEDVYVAGAEYNGTYHVAKIWKNGVARSLTNGTNNAGAYGIFVSGTDVYVAGYENNGTRDVATVWKNGVPQRLTDGIARGIAFSVYVSGNDVYVCGLENVGPTSTRTARLWKNGVLQNLNGASSGEARSVYVSGTDVYVGGRVINGRWVATVWKNGEPKQLSDGTNDSIVLNVFVFGNDVYAAGYQTAGVGFQNARLWKNGISQALPVNETFESSASAVFVK